MSDTSEKPSLCGLWADPEGGIHLAEACADGTRAVRRVDFSPYVWCRGGSGEPLAGKGSFDRLEHFEDTEDYQAFLKETPREDVVAVKPLEQQYLLETRDRLFGGLRFDQLRRCQLDIETACSEEGGFPSPRRKEDRVLAIGLSMGGEDHTLVLEEMTDAAERVLLKSLNDALEKLDPDVIEGHNIFKFDLEYLRRRCGRFKVPCRWGRFGQEASFRNSRIRIAERWIDFPRCDLPGRTVFDTYLMIQIYDVTTRDLASYSLKEVAVHLGISDRETRTYLKAHDIQKAFAEDRETFLSYLRDDLRETEGVAALLLPTYVAQIKSFPMTLQETCLRGTGGKVDLLFLEKYFHAGQALPDPPPVDRFEGAYSRSFVTGVYKHVLHYDVASLYPSLLLHIGRNPAGDSLGIFIPMLKELREERLRYKALAREAESAELRAEYQARQASFKILINSFYGYLGFGGARFADSELAAEVTRRGRELLIKLIEAFEQE
ncbi:MAG: DNA polymerase domain-containing protein, partial [Puniceicoccales bacterium]